MKYIFYGIGEWIKILGSMLLAHKRIVFSLLETNLDWNAATVQVCLAIKIFYCQ